MKKTLLLTLVVLLAVVVLTADGAKQKKPKKPKAPKMMEFRKVIKGLWKTCNREAMTTGINREAKIRDSLSGIIFDVCLDMLALSPGTADLHSLLADIDTGVFMGPSSRKGGISSIGSDEGNTTTSLPVEKKSSSKKKTSWKKKKWTPPKNSKKKKNVSKNAKAAGATTAPPASNVAGVSLNQTPTTPLPGIVNSADKTKKKKTLKKKKWSPLKKKKSSKKRVKSSGTTVDPLANVGQVSSNPPPNSTVG